LVLVPARPLRGARPPRPKRVVEELHFFERISSATTSPAGEERTNSRSSSNRCAMQKSVTK
jgi:hypothetical protein